MTDTQRSTEPRRWWLSVWHNIDCQPLPGGTRPWARRGRPSKARIEQQARDAQRTADMKRVRDAFQAGVKRKSETKP